MLHLIQFYIRMVSVDDHHLDSSNSFLICLSLHLGVPGFFGLLFALRWCTWVWVVGSFTPPLLSATPLAWGEGVLPGGFSTVQVPSLIFLSLVSPFRCAPESLLVCSSIVETPTANLSSSEETAESFCATSFIWGGCCGNKSAVVSAPRLCSITFMSILVPGVQKKYKVNTGRASYASLRLRTLGCRQVSQRLR